MVYCLFYTADSFLAHSIVTVRFHYSIFCPNINL